MADAIRVEGLAALRKDLRAMQPDTRKEVTRALRTGAAVVATAARPIAPVGATGKLATSYQPGAAGNKSFVRSRLPYAAVHEFGGVIRPKGTPITIRASRPIHKAFEDKAEDVVDVIGDSIEALARRHGWR